MLIPTAALLLLGAPPQEPEPAPPTPEPAATQADVEAETAAAAGFEVVPDWEAEGADAIAGQAREAALAAWRRCAELLGLGPDAEAPPATLHLHRHYASYDEATKHLKTNGRRARTDPETGEIHVCIELYLTDPALAGLGLPPSTSVLIAEHVARLAIAGRHGAGLPGWLLDGLAACMAERTGLAEGWIAEAEADPAFSELIAGVQDGIAEGDLPTASGVLDIGASGKSSATYGQRWLLVRFLMDEEAQDGFGDLRTLLAGVLAREGGGELACPPDRRGALDTAFGGYVGGLKPRWRELFPSLETGGNEWVQSGFGNLNAMAMSTEPIGTGNWEIRGELEFLPAQQQQMNVFFGVSEKDFYQATFVNGRAVGIFERREDREPQGKWLTRKEIEESEFQEVNSFKVTCENGRDVIMHLNGEAVLGLEIPDAELDAGWGLGVYVNAAGIWYSVELEPGEE